MISNLTSDLDFPSSFLRLGLAGICCLQSQDLVPEIRFKTCPPLFQSPLGNRIVIPKVPEQFDAAITGCSALRFVRQSHYAILDDVFMEMTDRTLAPYEYVSETSTKCRHGSRLRTKSPHKYPFTTVNGYWRKTHAFE